MADDERLIALVRENPVLYDLSHPDYMRTKLKDQIWDKIGDEFGSNGKTVKEQWRKLREEDHREALRRQKMKKSCAKAENQRPWTYQQQMDFLIPYMKNRPTSTNVEQQPSPEINAPDDEETITKGYIQDEPVTDNSNESERTESAISTTPTVKRMKQSDQTVMRRFIQTAEIRCKNRDDLRKAILQRDQSQSLQNDALYQFFLSMYHTTKGMPGKYQRRIRNTLYNAVSEAEEEIERGEELASIPARLPTKVQPRQTSDNNIINEAFLLGEKEIECDVSGSSFQVGEKNEYEIHSEVHTPSFSPSEEISSSASSSSYYATLLARQPQTLPSALIAVSEEARETWPTSGSYMNLG